MKKNFLILFLFPALVFAQKKETVSDTVKKHSPSKAAFFSAVIPGAGQVYNKKYWKVPIVYAAMGGMAYLAKMNRDTFLLYHDNYVYENDTNTVTTSALDVPVSYLESRMNEARKYMEMCYIALGLLYVLNIVDATVDAHLFTFDVSDDLSLRIIPEINRTFSRNNTYAGVKLVLKL